MKLEQDVIIDLLPAYFSGEGSAATRALVEEYFREHPEFEEMARGAGGPLDTLHVRLPGPGHAEEKLALERTRQLLQTRTAFFWLAMFYSIMPFLFRIRDGKIVWLMWERSGVAGIVFAVLAVFFWLGYFLLRRRVTPLPKHDVFMWVAILYTFVPFVFHVHDHKVVWVMFDPDPTVGTVFVFLAAVLWIASFVLRYKARRMEL
ncbi:MAG TPA: hypothetical protein VHN74_05375 [Candidatus Angelobacter sp.]|jgi:hypothetical protein|nr:hypothetical protein [Candidatus Angelobacter sp.]